MLRRVEFIGSGYEVVRFVTVDTPTMAEAIEAAKNWYKESGQDFKYIGTEIPKEYAYNPSVDKVVGVKQAFSSNEECASALYAYFLKNGTITANDPFLCADNILHDVNNLRGDEWLKCLQRNVETEPFFEYLDPGYIPMFHGDGAVLEDTFVFDLSISPSEYWALATGETGVVVSGLEELRNKMDAVGLGEVWDYSTSDIDEAVDNNEHLVLVEAGEISTFPNTECRIFEVTEEMMERLPVLNKAKETAVECEVSLEDKLATAGQRSLETKQGEVGKEEFEKA